jgi:hypothetical protein
MRLKHSIIVSLTCTAVTLIPSTSAGVTRFMLHYAIVNSQLKPDSDAMDTVSKLADVDHAAVAFLDEFWWKRTIASCDSELREAISRQVDISASLRKSDPDLSEDEIEEKEFAEIFDQIEACLHSYIFDHWDEIDKTFSDKLGAKRAEERERAEAIRQARLKKEAAEIAAKEEARQLRKTQWLTERRLARKKYHDDKQRLEWGVESIEYEFYDCVCQKIDLKEYIENCRHWGTETQEEEDDAYRGSQFSRDLKKMYR